MTNIEVPGVQGAERMLRFYTSEEVVQKFSWDFCVHFHSTITAALVEYEENLNEATVNQLVNQVFYQSLQRFNTPEYLQEHCANSRFMVNTIIDLPTDEEPETRVKIVVELIPLETSIALAFYDGHSQNLPTIH